MKRYKAKLDRNRLENTLKLTFERVPIEKVVGMYQNWSKYALKHGGNPETISWNGMPNNPDEVWKTYKFKSLDMKISSNKDRFNDDLQTVELLFSGKNRLDSVIHSVMLSFFMKYLKSVPEPEPFLRNIWLDKILNK